MAKNIRKALEEATQADEASVRMTAALSGAFVQLEDAKSKMRAGMTDLEKVVNELLTPEHVADMNSESHDMPIECGERIVDALTRIEQVTDELKAHGKLAKEFQTLTEKAHFAVAKVHAQVMVRMDRERERIRREENEMLERNRREEAARQQTLFGGSESSAYPS